MKFHRSLSEIEQAYQASLKKLSGQEKVARSIAMTKWARDAIAREIQAEKPDISKDRLRWEVA